MAFSIWTFCRTAVFVGWDFLSSLRSFRGGGAWWQTGLRDRKCPLCTRDMTRKRDWFSRSFSLCQFRLHYRWKCKWGRGNWEFIICSKCALVNKCLCIPCMHIMTSVPSFRVICTCPRHGIWDVMMRTQLCERFNFTVKEKDGKTLFKD